MHHLMLHICRSPKWKSTAMREKKMRSLKVSTSVSYVSNRYKVHVHLSQKIHPLRAYPSFLSMK